MSILSSEYFMTEMTLQLSGFEVENGIYQAICVIKWSLAVQLVISYEPSKTTAISNFSWRAIVLEIIHAEIVSVLNRKFMTFFNGFCSFEFCIFWRRIKWGTRRCWRRWRKLQRNKSTSITFNRFHKSVRLTVLFERPLHCSCTKTEPTNETSF